MHLDFFPALIAGIGILLWILVMCVDVIVRRFKLLLLQMIAPIPIISYVPRDVLKKVSRGLSRVEAGNPGFPRLVQVTSGGFSWWL